MSIKNIEANLIEECLILLTHITRKHYNENVEQCTSSFLIYFDYEYMDVYTLVIECNYPFVANGFLIRGLKEN